MTESTHEKHPDSDVEKGAVESDRPTSSDDVSPSDVSTTGQLGHRDDDSMIKEGDTDFPEPDAEAEHSGRASG
jgi:hypothetical protein